MYDSILVAIDDSEPAEAALEHAIDLAGSVGAALFVLSVVDPGGSPMRFSVQEVDALNRTVSEMVEDVLAAYEGHSLEIDAEVRRGRPDEIILEYAEEVDADLILVGQRGKRSLPHAILGSTADRVTRLSTIPVTIVPEPALENA